LCESYKNQSEKECGNGKEGGNIKVYCRFRPSQIPSNLRYDENMVDDGENKYSFDLIFGKYAAQE
jgi:hypothetical protein